MAGLSIAAQAPGWESTVRAMRAMPASIKREASRRGRDIAEPLAKEIRAAGHAQGSHAARAADKVKSGMKGGAPSVTSRGLPYIMGSEYGGGIRRSTYYSTSRLGRRYLIVGRHTTRQFRAFKGKEGYWFTPQLTAGSPGREAVLDAWAKLIDDVMRTV
jgi:hypothetical protein